MANLKIKALLEKLIKVARKNKLRGIAATIGGLSSEEVSIGNQTTNCNNYVQIVPRGTLNEDFDYSTTVGYESLFELVYNPETDTTSGAIPAPAGPYPGIKIKQPGLYLVEGTVYFGVNYTAEDRVYITIHVNYTGENKRWFTERMSSTYQIGKLTRLVYLNANDIVELRASNYTSKGRGSIYFSGATRLSVTLMNPTL